MKINQITFTPAYKNYDAQNKNNIEFRGICPKTKSILKGTGILASTAIIGAWLLKLFKSYPQDSSIYLNDGSYFCEAYELNTLA